MMVVTVIGLSNAYQEEPDFWTHMDFHGARGRFLKDCRGLRFRQGLAVKMIEDGETAMKTNWDTNRDCRLNDYCGLLERRFNQSSKSHKHLKNYIYAITRGLEPNEGDEDVYYMERRFA